MRRQRRQTISPLCQSNMQPFRMGPRFITHTVLTPILVLALLAFTGKAFAWTVTADFEAGTPGTLANGPDAFSTAAGSRTLYSTEQAKDGIQSARMEWLTGDQGFNSTKGRIDFPVKPGNGDEIWMRGYFFFKSPWSWFSPPAQGNAIKIMRYDISRVRGGATFNSVIGKSTGVPKFTIGTNAPQNLFQNVGTPANLGTDEWISLEFYMKIGTGTSGILRFWVDGILKAEHLNIQTLQTIGDVYDFSFWMSQWNGGAPQNQIMYIDDIVITTDTPGGRDALGNPMIGLQPSVADTTPPAPPTGLRIQ